VIASRRRLGGLQRLAGTLVVGVLVLGGCQLAPPPEPAEVIDVDAFVAVAGAQLSLVLPPYSGTITVEALRAETTVRFARSGDRLRVAWVGGAANAGGQVRLRFAPSLDEPPQMDEGVVLAAAGGTNLGLGVLRLSSSADGATHATPLAVDALPVGELTLDPAWAGRPLGDVDGSGVLDVGDALRLVAMARAGSGDEDERYHADLTLDDVVGAADLELALERLVDPGLPARLHVRPRAVPFVALAGAGGLEAWVLVGNAGRAPFADLEAVPPSGVVVAPSGGLPGQSLAVSVDLPASARRGWRPGTLRIEGGTESAEVRLGHVVVLVAGQSNATGLGSPLTPWPEVASPAVRLFGNDYRWRDLFEPMDSASAQVDAVSEDTNVGYSLGTRLGFGLWDATGFESYLIPSTRNASKLESWQPPTNRLDRSTLFGSTNFRAQVSAGLQQNPVGGQPFGSEGGPVTSLVWYQGESDANAASDRGLFQARTNAVMNAFDVELGMPVVYVQLASDWREQVNVQQHAVAELQRRLESTWGVLGQRRSSSFHMVVAFDLPRSDRIHLSAFGQRVLAERVALAIRQHVFGEDVDGTGPRLDRDQVAWSGTSVWVQTTHVLAAASLNKGYFTVFDGPPNGSLDDVATYGDNTIPIASVVRDPADPSAVRLTLERAPGSTPFVRYMALPGVGPSTTTPTAPETWDVMAPGVVVADEGGLPLPAFGPLAAIARP